MELNFSRIEAVVKEEVNPEIQKAYQEAKTLYNKIMKGRGKATNSRGVRIPSQIRPNGSFGGFSEGGALPDPGSPEFIEMKVFPTNVAAGFRITGTALANLHTEDAIIGKISDIITLTADSAKKDIDYALAGDGTGELARVVTRDSGTQITVSTTYANGNVFSSIKLKDNASLMFVNPSTNAYRSATPSVVSSTEHGTGVVTMDAVPAGVAAGDRVVYANSFNKFPHGLSHLINNGNGMIQGQSRGTYKGLRSIAEDMLGATITTAALNKVRGALRFRTERSDNTTLLSAIGQKLAYEEQGHNLIRFQPGGVFQQDFKDVKHGHNGNGWIDSDAIDYDRVYGVDFALLFKYELEKFGVLKGDGNTMRMYTNGTNYFDSYIGWVGVRFDLGTPLPAAHFLLKNFAFDGQPTGPYAWT